MLTSSTKYRCLMICVIWRVRYSHAWLISDKVGKTNNYDVVGWKKMKEGEERKYYYILRIYKKLP